MLLTTLNLPKRLQIKKYTSEDIEKFLLSIDHFLTKNESIIIIGGTAASLAYQVTESTKDIDTWNSIEGLKEAYEKAKIHSSLSIPLEQVSVADAPTNFEDRLTIYRPEIFTRLQVIVPEVIDLILMKTLRAYSHDLDAIEQMVKSQNVKYQNLILRYTHEMNATIGDKRKHDINFLAMIERCYDTITAKKAQKEIKFTPL